MLKRSLVFTTPAALSLKNAQLVITLKEQPDACRTVPIEELGVVLVDSPMVTLTIPLINALAAYTPTPVKAKATANKYLLAKH